MFGEVLVGFLQGFGGFLFFFTLLNGGKIGLLELILLFLWGLYVLG